MRDFHFYLPARIGTGGYSGVIPDFQRLKMKVPINLDQGV